MTSSTQRREFDAVRLAAFLRSELGLAEQPLVERIAGGQSNPTYFVTSGRRKMVLRKQPAGVIMPSAHAIDREYTVIRALADTDVPVPKPILFCDDSGVIGTPFYLMERLEGRVFHDCSLSKAAPGERKAMYRSMAETLARLHAVDSEAVGLAGFGRGKGYLPRQIKRWNKQWDLSKTRESPEIDQAFAWLLANCPEDDGVVTIVHGDFRPGNVLFEADTSRIAGVLDWELSTLGHPMADLAHGCIAWRSAPEEYGGLLGTDLGRLCLPGETDYLRWYYEASGRNLPLTSFHLVLALLRFAVIFEGIAARASIGNAAAENAATTGLLSQAFARRAVETLERSSAGAIV